MNMSDYILPGKKIFMPGIGGVSMSALAHLLSQRGVVVSGSDRSESPVVDKLRSAGIAVFIGHDAGNVGDADCLIRTAAVHDDNPEVTEAHRRGIPVFERADGWGAIMSEHRAALCISGTHGKTTVTSMAVSIAMASGADVTAMIGGQLAGLGEHGAASSHRVGSGDLIIAEACEYCNSFLRFRPTVAAILNVEADHLDFFSGLDDIMASFREFARLAEGGRVVVNADDAGALATVEGLDNVTTYGVKSTDAMVRTRNLVCERGRYSFDIVHAGGMIPVTLKIPGLYNVSNAVCAAACMLELGFSGADISRGFAAYGGTARRFEYKGDWNGAEFYDDFAHHPSELAALFDAVRDMGYRRVLCVFQPHTYSRTKEHFSDFAQQLARPDLLCLLPIYAAREAHDPTVSSALLGGAVAGSAGGVYVADDHAESVRWVRENAREGDLVLMVGAGEAYMVADEIVGLA